MISSLSRLFTRRGKIPRKYRRELEEEDIIFSAERIPGKLLIETINGPHGHTTLSTEAITGCLVITHSRIFWSTTRKHLVNLPLNDPEDFRYLSLHVRTSMPTLLAISYNAIDMLEGWEGVWEFRFNIPDTQKTCETLLGLGLKQGTVNE
jgi:hypothetical protein